MNNKPIINQSLSDKAAERERQATGRNMASIAGWLVGIGLIVSAVLTIAYLMLLVEEAAGLPSPYGYVFGLLVGVVAVVPAELALVIWRSRLDSDATITTGQRGTAVTAIILAGIFSALTTSSFFSYFLPQLFPPSYLAVAPTLNVGAIVGSWIVFILAIVSYSVFSRQTQQNLAQAKANQGIFDARMDVLRSAGEAIRGEAENWITLMDENGIFGEDAKRLIANALGMEDDRIHLPHGHQRPTLPAPEENDPPGLMDRIRSLLPAGRDVYIVHRLTPARGGWKEVGPFDNYQDAESHVKSDAGNHAAGTKYRITSHGRDIALFEVDATGHAIEERPAPAPVRPPGNGNGRPVQEATGPAWPSLQNKLALYYKPIDAEEAQLLITTNNWLDIEHQIQDIHLQDARDGDQFFVYDSGRRTNTYTIQWDEELQRNYAHPGNRLRRPTPPQST